MVYCDASLNGEKKEAGISCVVKDAKGDVINVSSKIVRARDILDAELNAVVEAKRLLQRMKVDDDFVLYTDNQPVVSFLQGEFDPPRRIMRRVNEILDFCNPLPIRWIRRENNSCADALAVYASRRGN